MTKLVRYPGLPRDEGSGGKPGTCDRCGKPAPRGKRICRPCRRDLSPPKVRRRRVSVRAIYSGLPSLGRRR
jgi:predicted amidophosphoribosyltransferase